MTFHTSQPGENLETTDYGGQGPYAVSDLLTGLEAKADVSGWPRGFVQGTPLLLGIWWCTSGLPCNRHSVSGPSAVGEKKLEGESYVRATVGSH